MYLYILLFDALSNGSSVQYCQSAGANRLVLFDGDVEWVSISLSTDLGLHVGVECRTTFLLFQIFPDMDLAPSIS